MTDTEILKKALERYRAATHENAAFKDDVVIFLEKEIDRYRDMIQHMEYNIDRMESNVESLAKKNNELKARLNAIYGEPDADAVQERPVTEIIKALANNGYKTITLNFYKD